MKYLIFIGIGIILCLCNVGDVANETIGNIIHSDDKERTYEQVSHFLANDRTDKRKYLRNSFNCNHFSNLLIKNAREANYKVGFVTLHCDEDSFYQYDHAIVCFKTSNKGLIFVEPQDDEMYYQSDIDDGYFPVYPYDMILDPVNMYDINWI